MAGQPEYTRHEPRDTRHDILMALLESGGRNQLLVSLGRIYRMELSMVSPELIPL